MRTAGVPLQFDRELKRYFLDSTLQIPPTQFTAKEALTLIVLGKQLGLKGQLPFFQASNIAAKKLQASIPLELQAEIERASEAISIQLPAVNPMADKEDIFARLLDAAINRTAIDILYGSLTEWEPITTRLRPYRLLFSRSSWYVVGRSSLHSEVRTFNVGRIAKATATEQKFQLPQNFSLKKHLRNAWRIIPQAGPDSNVCIRFHPMVAKNVAEVEWHPTQRVEWNEDGSINFHVRVSGVNEISWWIMAYGDQAEVLAPVKLRRMISLRAKSLIAMYEKCEQAKT